MIFISHQHKDKKFAEIIKDFMLKIEVPNEDIFCSSSDGSAVNTNFHYEIKEKLKSSNLNFVLLSNNYYKSYYCNNEAGIIWFLDKERVIVGLDEINIDNMKGFLDSTNMIRRLSSRDDFFAIAKILKKIFPNVTDDVTAVNYAVKKALEEYNTEIIKNENKVQVNETLEVLRENEIDTLIRNKKILDSELITLQYFIDSNYNFLHNCDIKFNEWLKKNNIVLQFNETNMDLLVDSNICEVHRKSFDDFYIELKLEHFRNLQSLSKSSKQIIKEAVTKHMNKIIHNENKLDILIKKMSKQEIVFLKYIIDNDKVDFKCGWQQDKEEKDIVCWFEINKISNDSKLNFNYQSVSRKFKIKKIFYESQIADVNPKLYSIHEEYIEDFHNLNENSLEYIEDTIKEFKYEELPF